MRLGILGGSFNPLHNTHLEVARRAREAHRLDRVLLIPAASPPHKTTDLAPPSDRLAMTELACQGEHGLGVSAIEIERDGPSYTVDTLDEIARTHPEAELFFLMGADSLQEFHTWREPERILRLASIVVVNRPGYEIELTKEQFPQFSEADLLRIERDQVRMPPSSIRATDVREAVRAGRSTADWVPPCVSSYIQKRRLYL